MNRITRTIAEWYLRSAAPSLWSNIQGWGALAGGGPTVSGISVDPKSALTLTAAYAAVNTIATDVASLPLQVFRRRDDGGSDLERTHPVAELLAGSPDGETTSMRWRQAKMGHTLGWGNGTSEIVFDDGGRPAVLHLLDPRTRAERREDKTLQYRLASGKTLPPDRVLHVAGLGFDGLSGYSPIELSREAIALGKATERFGGSFFGNGAQAGGYLKLSKRLTAEAKASLRNEWAAVHQGSGNAHKIAVLEEGMEFQQSTINPELAQFLATRQFQVVEIARMFRLPPHKIGDFTQSHLSNIESANLDYLITVLMPWCEAIEQEFNRKLFTKEERAQGFYCEHNMTALLRGDMKARAEFYTKLRDLGVLTPNMISRLENLNPIGAEGDKRLVPLNMTTLESAGAPKVDPSPVSVTVGTQAPAVDPAAAAGAPIANTALNGSQVTSLLEITNEVANGTLPAATAKGLILASFPGLTDAQVDAILAPLEGFKPATPEPDPVADPKPPKEPADADEEPTSEVDDAG